MPLQRPRPVTLNAAFSPVGRDFAAKTADFLFTTFVDIEGGRPQIADMATRAHAAGREVGVYTTCHVVCRPTQDEAEDYYEHYAVRMEDTASVDFYMGAKEKFSVLARSRGVSAASQAVCRWRRHIPPDRHTAA